MTAILELAYLSTFYFLLSTKMFKPLSNRVLIEPVEEEKVSKGGIVLPDSADKKKQSRGTVIAIGPGRVNDKGERMPVSVAIGQKVLFKEPWGEEHKIEDGDKKYLLVEEDDVLAVIE
jgi:chaperonin GroES